MDKYKTGGTFSVKQSYTDEQLTAYTIGSGNVTLAEPMPIIDPYEEKIKDAHFKIEILLWYSTIFPFCTFNHSPT